MGPGSNTRGESRFNLALRQDLEVSEAVKADFICGHCLQDRRLLAGHEKSVLKHVRVLGGFTWENGTNK